MNLRAERGRRIFELGNQIRRVSDLEYQVKSQTEYGKWYELLHTSRGYLCSCPDWMAGEPWCKHAWATELFNGDRARAERGCMIFAAGGVERVSDDRYRVAAQSSGKSYDVTRSNRQWKCTCRDHTFDLSHCKHIFASEIAAGIRDPKTGNAIVRPHDPGRCKHCGSGNTGSRGYKRLKKGTFRNYRCRDCKRFFIDNLGFERKRADAGQITMAVEMLLGGLSTRKTAAMVSARGVKVSHQTVWNWTGEFVGLMDTHMDTLVPMVGEEWMTDEIYANMRGDLRYLFNMLDTRKRFWLAGMVREHKGTSDATQLFADSRDVGGKVPTWLRSDGAANFHAAWRDVFRSKGFTHKETVHLSHAHANGDYDNNAMEAFNGDTVRLREVVTRGLKSEDTPILTGLRLYHNFLRPHLGLEGNVTPGEAAGIIIEGQDKILTMIQAAARMRCREAGQAEGGRDGNT